MTNTLRRLDESAHPLWPYTKLRWEALTPAERKTIKNRVDSALWQARHQATVAETMRQYIEGKEAAPENGL
jgi:hypothetical protein